MRKKHRNDYNHGKNGWVGGNPRYGKSRGFRKGSRAKTKQLERQTMTTEDNDLGTFENNNCCRISYDTVREAMNGENYTMTMAGEDADYVMNAVNQGIDARLEACYCPERGDSYEWAAGRRLVCEVSPESLPVLLRRLFEADNEENEGGPGLLAGDILMTLGIDEHGKLVGREALGLD